MNSNQYRTDDIAPAASTLAKRSGGYAEMITQADILDRLVQIQDKLYRMENELRSISGTLANMRQDLPVVPLQNHTGHPWEEQAP